MLTPDVDDGHELTGASQPKAQARSDESQKNVRRKEGGTWCDNAGT
jgi:hypothetical protein